MMALDDIREMIVEARRSEAAAKPFPSGVAAGDDRTGLSQRVRGGPVHALALVRQARRRRREASPLRRLRPRPRLSSFGSPPISTPASRAPEGVFSTPAPSKSGWCCLTFASPAHPTG